MRGAVTQRGFLLIVAVILIAVAAVMAAVVVALTAGSGIAGSTHMQSTQALYAARSGMEHGMRLLLSPTLAERIDCTVVTGDTNLTNIATGNGRYTVTGGTASYLATAATLNGALSATATIVPFSSALAAPSYGMSSAGRVLIDREVLDYAEISSNAAECGGSAPCLLGVQRARDGTTAAAHASGARLGQYQCDLVSAGGVPDLASTDHAQRTISKGVQLQEGWAVGDGGVILRWNGNTWTLFATTGTILRAVSMGSYANGWTVGDVTGGAPQIRRWNPDGTPAWDAVAAPALTNANRLNAVHTLASNEAWVAGNDRTGGANNAMVLRFTGAAWAYSDPGNDRSYNGIFMLDTDNDGDADDGWLVGERSGGNYAFMRWNNPTANAWNQVLLSSGNREDLNGIYMISNADGWAVGQARSGNFNFVRWNGVTWSAAWVLSSASNRDLNGVYMLSSTDGWAVGDNGVILRWNSPTANVWNLIVAPNVLTVNNLNAVACAASDDCWTAGNAGTLLHWDGASWTTHAQSGVVTAQNLRGIGIVAPRDRPGAGWREVFP